MRSSTIKRKGIDFLKFIYLSYTIYFRLLSLPTWTQQVYRSANMTFVTQFAFSIATYTRELARLKVGQLIKEILQRCKNKANKILKPDRSMWIYSGHDLTIANLLNALKIFEVSGLV